MKRSNLVVTVETSVLLVAGVAAALLPKAAFTYYDLLGFIAGLALLKLSDVWLPQGDAIGMSSALALGALLLFDARFVLAVLAVAELLALIPHGRERKWRLALGALTAEAAATVICSATLVPLGLHPLSGILTRVDSRLRPQQYLFVLLVGLLFAALEHAVLQFQMAMRDRRPFASSILGSLSYGGWLIAAQASAGVLAALMYRTMGLWGLLVSIVMILVMRQSFVLLLDIRQAYDSTIGVLVRAMEAQTPACEGAAGRNADLCLKAGRALGMHGRELERVRYAALLLGLGSEEQGVQLAEEVGSSTIIDGIAFLGDVSPILRLCDDPSSVSTRRSDLTCAYLVMAAAAATGSVRSTRLARLRDRVSPRVLRDVDSAVAAALETAVDSASPVANAEAQ